MHMHSLQGAGCELGKALITLAYCTALAEGFFGRANFAVSCGVVVALLTILTP